MIAVGHNGRIAWGITSGLDDDDDLYVERLAGRSATASRAARRKMDCRNETFRVAGASSPSSSASAAPSTARSRRARAAETAYARRYAIWDRELDTLQGLAALNAASSVAAGRTRRRSS